MSPLNTFLSGAVFMASLTIAMHFLKLWRRTGDRLFGYFLAAFVALALDRVAQVGLGLPNEFMHYVYLVRLAAFALIIAGVIEKNRAR